MPLINRSPSPYGTDWYLADPGDAVNDEKTQVCLPNFLARPFLGESVQLDGSFSGLFPALPSGLPNPSSELAEAPIRNVVDPDQKQFGAFSGFFRFANGTTVGKQHEHGTNNLWKFREDPDDPAWGGGPTTSVSPTILP